MSRFHTNLNFDTDFCVPSDCLREGDVTCRVVFSECDVINRWDELLTFRLKLILRLTVSRDELECSFDEEIVLKETVWLTRDAWVTDCQVKAAGCRCVLQQGLVYCSGAVSVEFCYGKPEPLCPLPVEHCAPCERRRPHRPRRKRCH